MIPRRVMLFFVLLLVLVVSASSAWAQFTSGIEGTVTRSYRRQSYPEQRSPSRTTKPGRRRQFKPRTPDFSALPPCPRRPSPSAPRPGIQDHGSGTCSASVAETKTVNMHMVVGGTDSTVTVTEDVPPSNLGGAGVWPGVGKEVHDLPLSGRNFYTLVVLTPGVTGIASGGRTGLRSSHRRHIQS